MSFGYKMIRCYMTVFLWPHVVPSYALTISENEWRLNVIQY